MLSAAVKGDLREEQSEAEAPGELSEDAHAYPRVQALLCPRTPQTPLWEMPGGKGSQYLQQVGP